MAGGARNVGTALAAGTLFGLVLIDILISNSIVLSPLFALSPLIACAVLPTRRTAVFAAAAVVAAIGAVDPFHFGYLWILWVIFFSVMAGGAISIVVMTAKGQLWRSLRNVFRAAFTFVMPGLQHEPLKPENSEKIPFGLGIAFGTLWTVWMFHTGLLPN